MLVITVTDVVAVFKVFLNRYIFQFHVSCQKNEIDENNSMSQGAISKNLLWIQEQHNLV